MEKASEKDSFLLHRKFKEVFAELEPEQAGQLILAVFEYEETQQEPDLEAILRIAWIPIRQWLDERREAYENTCKERSKAGKKGGRPQKQKVVEESKKTNCFFEKAKKAESDSESDSESDGAKAPNDCAEQAPAPPPVITLTLNDKSEYPITQTQVDEWTKLYPAVDIMQELRKMKGWLKSNPRKRKTKAGILRFVTSWLAREQDKGRASPPQNTVHFANERKNGDYDHLAVDLFSDG